MFGKKRVPQEPCSSCGRGLRESQKVCACGAATRHMNFEERTEYEVAQWRAHREQLAQAQTA